MLMAATWNYVFPLALLLAALYPCSGGGPGVQWRGGPNCCPSRWCS